MLGLSEFRGRKIYGGYVEGVALVSREPISFYGGVDPDTAVIVEKGHVLEGVSIAGKILIFPWGKGSTVGSYIIYRLYKNGLAPTGIVNIKAEPIVTVGAIISNIPMIDLVHEDIFDIVRSGDRVVLDADNGVLRCIG